MFKFSQSMFNNLMGIVAFKIMEKNWKCATRHVKFGVTFMAESATKGASDVIVVANFLVCFVVEFSVAAWAVCRCLKVFLLLCGENHGLPCHFVIASV